MKTIPCPKCRQQGNDRRGDNLVVYPDDSKYCFACGYYESGIAFKRVLRGVLEGLGGEGMVTYPILPYGSPELPEWTVNWLSNYQLSWLNIPDSYFSPVEQRFIIPLSQDGIVKGWLGRSEPGTIPKWKQVGHKFPVVLNRNSSRKYILVEDIISAYKLYNCKQNVICLLGTGIDYSFVSGIADEVVIWLDPDMKGRMIETGRVFMSLGISYNIIYSNSDPKSESYSNIYNYIYNI